MLLFRVEGKLMTADEYAARKGVGYFRAIHELAAIERTREEGFDFSTLRDPSRPVSW